MVPPGHHGRDAQIIFFPAPPSASMLHQSPLHYPGASEKIQRCMKRAGGGTTCAAAVDCIGHESVAGEPLAKVQTSDASRAYPVANGLWV